MIFFFQAYNRHSHPVSSCWDSKLLRLAQTLEKEQS